MKKQLLRLLFLSAFISHTTQAAERWKFTPGLQGSFVDYSGSKFRDGVKEIGGLFAADYLDEGGVTLGYTRTDIKFKAGLPTISQDSYFGSLRKHLYLDDVPGKITLRADGYLLSNTDSSGATDGINVWATQASFATFDKQYYLDVGYARSAYRNMFVNQYTPTAGMALFDSDGWLQLRGYFIDPSNPTLSQGINFTQAAEAKYTHFLTPNGLFKPNNLQIAGVYGNRLYAVDMDAATVTNLSDIQRGGLIIGAEWKFGSATKMLLQGGQNTYVNRNIGDNYESRFLYVNVNTVF